MFKGFTEFMARIAKRLSAIAYSTRSGRKGRDLQGDVWVAAAEFEEHHGRDVDFENRIDQEDVLNRVYWNARRERDWKLEGSLSLDLEEDEGFSLAERLPGRADADPVIALEDQQVAAANVATIRNCYSQATAYVVVFASFDDNRRQISAYLAIVTSTLRARVRRANELVKVQASLFDGIHKVADDFMPMPGIRRAQPATVEVDDDLCGWLFHNRFAAVWRRATPEAEPAPR